MTYLENIPYSYPPDDNAVVNSTMLGSWNYLTGWGILPNILWKHFATPKAWADFCIKYEAYHIDSMKITVFNMIPMTTQLAIQGNTLFTAFNNTIYALAYQDQLYETGWMNWFEDEINEACIPNLAWKEGLLYNINSTTKKRSRLPIYSWPLPVSRTQNEHTWANSYSSSGNAVYPLNGRPSGLFWDPLNRPDELKELRPGKNAVHFTWESHQCDGNLWYNIDQIAQWYPYTATGPYNVAHQRPGQYHITEEDDPDALATKYQSRQYTNDYTIPNFANVPIMSAAWWWHEMKGSIGQAWNTQKLDLFFCGTEAEQAKYLPEQFFLKLIPLFDASGTNIEISAQISVRTELHVSAKKRRSAIYCPTWGPWSWRTLYSAQTAEQIFQPSMIRYRTGGMRRTWQNLRSSQRSTDDKATDPHPREDPYNANIQSSGSGIGGTFLKTTVKDTSPNLIQITPTTSTKTTPTPMEIPIAPKRRISPELATNSMIFKHISDTQL